MAKLTDLQLVLLSSATARGDGSLLPPAASIAAQSSRITKAITTLIKRALVADARVQDAGLAYRSDGDDHFGATITDAGREAVGMPVAFTKNEQASVLSPVFETALSEAVSSIIVDSQPKPATKLALLIDLLRRDGGASLADLAGATGWLPHTTRAALTGLRKKGHVLDKTKVDDVTRYTIAAAA